MGVGVYKVKAMRTINSSHIFPLFCSIVVEFYAIITTKHVFYAPQQKVAGYYVIPSELLSVCPSVCPSVRPSAVVHSRPLHNFDTL